MTFCKTKYNFLKQKSNYFQTWQGSEYKKYGHAVQLHEPDLDLAGFTAPDRSLFVVSEMGWWRWCMNRLKWCAWMCVCKSLTACLQYVCRCVLGCVYLWVQGHCTECGGQVGQWGLTRPATAWQTSSGCFEIWAGHRCFGPFSSQIEVLSVGRQSMRNIKHLTSRAISLEMISLGRSLWMRGHLLSEKMPVHVCTHIEPERIRINVDKSSRCNENLRGQKCL